MVFGTDGIRQKMGQHPLDEKTVRQIANILNQEFKNQTVVVGRDSRASGTQLQAWLLDQAEFDVLDLGMVPTPVVAVETQKRGAKLGLMLTASHNPPEYNGIKFFNEHGLKLESERASIWSQLIEETSPTVPGKIKQQAIQPDFYEKLLTDHFNQNPIGVVWDLAHGAGALRGEHWIKNLMPNATVLGNQPSGTNINVGAGSMAPEALCEAVRTTKSVAGFALDGDGDRLLVVTAKGEILHGDRVLFSLILALEMQGVQVEKSVGTILNGLGLEQSLSEKGIQFYRTPVGDQHVLAKMVGEDAQVGGEPSGHFILPHIFPAGDGLIAGLTLGQALSHHPQMLDEVANLVPLLPTDEQSIPVREKPNLEDLGGISKAKRILEEKMGAKGRLILRYSGTEPKIRVMVESPYLTEFDSEIRGLKDAIRKEIGCA